MSLVMNTRSRGDTDSQENITVGGGLPDRDPPDRDPHGQRPRSPLWTDRQTPVKM